MKVAIIGVGGVGRTLAQLLRAETAIDSLLLIDKEENRVRFFTKMMGRGKGGRAPLHLDAPAGPPRPPPGCAHVAKTPPPTAHPPATDGGFLARGHSIAVSASIPRQPA